MRLMIINCNRGNPIDGGFKHTVFDIATLNGNNDINIISTTKFNDILHEHTWINDYMSNPDKFLKGLNDVNYNSEIDNSGGGDIIIP